MNLIKDIFADRSGKKIGALGPVADHTPPLYQREFKNICLTHADTSLIRRIEAFQKLKNSSFTGPAWTDEGRCFPLRGCKGKIFQYRLIFVGKGYIFKQDISFHPV